MLPDDALAEFASTYKEWHYLAGGFALGVVAGIAIALAFVVSVANHHRRQGRMSADSERF